MLTNKPSQVNYIEAYIFIYILFILSAVYISYSLSKAPPQGTELFQGTFVVSMATKPEDINLEK